MKREKNILTYAIITLIAIITILIIYNITKNPTGALKEIKYSKIIEKIENKENFILIISQSTCSHCATYKPKVEKIAKDYDIIVYYIDIDKEHNKEKILEELNLSGSTPMTLFFENGKEKSILNRIEGDLSPKRIINQFQKMGFIN